MSKKVFHFSSTIVTITATSGCLFFPPLCPKAIKRDKLAGSNLSAKLVTLLEIRSVVQPVRCELTTQQVKQLYCPSITFPVGFLGVCLDCQWLGLGAVFSFYTLQNRILLSAARARKYLGVFQCERCFFKVGLYEVLQQVHDCPILDIFLVLTILSFISTDRIAGTSNSWGLATFGS